MSESNWKQFLFPKVPSVPCPQYNVVCRGDAGGANTLRGLLRVSQRHRVWLLLGGASVRHHKLRQHRPGHADCLPVHHSRGLDWHALLGPRLPGQDLAMVLLCHDGHPRLLLCHEPHPRCPLWRVLQRERKGSVTRRLPEAESETADGGGPAGLHGLDLQGELWPASLPANRLIVNTLQAEDLEPANDPSNPLKVDVGKSKVRR